jgi:hypothetical protein
MLDHARTPAGATYDVDPARLRVVDEWASVCVDFEEAGPGKEIIADAVARWPDGAEAGVILWGYAGRLQGLEVYDHTLQASHRLPSVAQLYTYAQIGEMQARRGPDHEPCGAG